MAPSSPKLVVGLGDIHGRFHRVGQWLRELEANRGREVSLALAVGDVEAFLREEDHRRKAAKRTMPAEFADYASGAARLARPLCFIGGNNEDFEVLHRMPQGGELAPGATYLGRSGVKELQGLRIGYLSGILAPKHFERPIVEPSTQETRKQAGYFRADDVARLWEERDVDVMLVHEWPRGLLRRRPKAEQARPLRAYRMPWIGNPITRELMDRVRPRWLWAGHSHVPFATTVAHEDGSVTRVACLDQAAKPDGAVFWIEFQDREAIRAGWGLSGKPCWSAGEPFSEALTPEGGEGAAPG